MDGSIRITRPYSATHIRSACSSLLELPEGMYHLRERSGSTAGAKHSKGQDEDHDLGTTVQSRRNDVVVLDEELGVLLPQIPLGEETQEEEHADGRVDTNKQITHLPEDDGRVDVSKRWMRVKAIGEPKGDWDDKTDEICYRDLCDPCQLECASVGFSSSRTKTSNYASTRDIADITLAWRPYT